MTDMTEPAIVVPTNHVPAPADDLDALTARAATLAHAARAAATRRAYAGDWNHFAAWCAGRGLTALPASPRTVGLYLTAHAETLRVATLTRRLSSIAVIHRTSGQSLDTQHPGIRDVLAGLRRTKGVAPRRVEALTTPLLKRLLATCGGDRLIDLRDRGVLLVGFGGALRRSELVALQFPDVTVAPEGLRVVIRQSKGDQERAGQVIGIGRTGRATCPVAAFEAWVAAAGISIGPVFRSVDRHGRVGRSLTDRAVALIVQQRAGLAGLDPAAFAGHSLRAGFATSAAAGGVEERAIMEVTRHTSTAMVRRYIRDGRTFARNLAVEVGL